MNNANTTDDLAHRIDAIRDSLLRLFERGGDAASQVKARAIDIEHQAEARAKTFAGKVGEVIKAHPIAAVSLAFAIGYAAIRIVRR